MHVMQEMQETGVRSPGKGSGSPLQYSLLKNPMDRGAWREWAKRDGGEKVLRRDLREAMVGPGKKTTKNLPTLY